MVVTWELFSGRLVLRGDLKMEVGNEDQAEFWNKASGF